MANQLFAQQDSTILELEKLEWKHVFENESVLTTNVISGLRIPCDINDLPFTIFVITQDEILLNGYNTLVDAISSLPGIRISQPGSGEDGESFMMRGYYGNTYAKILINNYAVKPYMLKAFPIGAQLPIKNIERIEVLYGPSSSVHGVDATAGVINIITKKNIKPHSIQANYSIGDGTYQNINVMYETNFGVLGKKFGMSLYGSATQYNQLNLDYEDPDNLDPELYDLDGRYLSLENYSGTRNKAILGDFPHSSQLFGLELQYGKFRYESQLMYRKDHSSLGLNPTAVAYNNPLIFTGEKINNIRLEYKDQLGKINLKTSANILSYGLDNRTSNVYVAPLELYLEENIIDLENDDPQAAAQLKDENYNNRYTDIRYSFGHSLQYNIEQTFSITGKRNNSYVIGAKYDYGKGVPLIKNLKDPIEEKSTRDVINEQRSIDFTSFTAFGQAFYDLKNIKLIIDAHFGDLSRLEGTLDNIRNFKVIPRVALLYRINNSLRARISYSQSLRVPAANLLSATNSIVQNDGEPSILGDETSIYYNAGINWKISENTLIDADYYQYTSDGALSYTIEQNIINQDRYRFDYGYFGALGSFEITGLQFFIRTQDLLKNINLNVDMGLNFSTGKEIHNGLSFGEIEYEPGTLSSNRAFPNFIGKFNFSFRPLPRFYTKVQTTYLSNSSSYSFPNNLRFESDEVVPGGLIIDFVARIQLNRNFGIYGKVNNLLNTKYGGIDASDNLDALKYNPQRLIGIRLGMDYIIK